MKQPNHEEDSHENWVVSPNDKPAKERFLSIGAPTRFVRPRTNPRSGEKVPGSERER